MNQTEMENKIMEILKPRMQTESKLSAQKILGHFRRHWKNLQNDPEIHIDRVAMRTLRLYGEQPETLNKLFPGNETGKMPFGKFKGMQFKVLPTHYLTWLLQQVQDGEMQLYTPTIKQIQRELRYRGFGFYDYEDKQLLC